MRKTILMLLAGLLAGNLLAGDILTLAEGPSFEGKIIRIRDCHVTFRAGGEKFRIPAADILSIRFEDPQDKVYTEYLRLSAQDPNRCFRGKTDAALYHGKNGGHFLLGVLFGPIAMVGTALSSPYPEKGRRTVLMSTNKDLFSDPEYLLCYKKKAKGKLIGMEALGWGTWILALVLAYQFSAGG